METTQAGSLQLALTRVLQMAGADMILLGELLDSPMPRIRTLSCCKDGLWLGNFSYVLKDHPCLFAHAQGTYSIADVNRISFPKGYVMHDHDMSAYAGQMVSMNGGEFKGIITALRRTAFDNIDRTREVLAAFAAKFSQQHEALLREVEHARFEYAAFVRSEFFDEYVLNNQEGIAFSEFMPPVPIDLPRAELLERAMHTAYVVESNRAIARMYDYASPQAMLGATPFDVNGPKKAPRVVNYWLDNNCVLRDVESHAVDADGKVTWIRGNAVGKIRDGKILHFWTRRQDITSEKRYEASVLHKAHHDTLTGLPNRHWFQERADAMAEDHLARGKRFCLGLLDLNGFKEINDTLGHLIGDQLLQAVAIRLLRGIKPHGAEIARLGGDEFAILMPDILDESQCDAMAKAVQGLLHSSFTIEGMNLQIGGALGLALSGNSRDASSDLLRHADIAMYAAKKEGRGHCWYLPAQDQHSRRRLALITALPGALERNELFLVYQPKIDLSDNSLSGFEALIRWQHPELGVIFPDDFIPLAETNEVIAPLTRWVLMTAIRQAAIWHAAGVHISMAINISARNLVDDRLVNFLRDALASQNFPADCLELELTESSLMTRPGQAMAILLALRKQGIQLAIDDFGKGYSSLSYLAHLPVSTLKVDQSFVQKMIQSKTDELIVRAVIGLAHQCHLKVVAEGVEDQSTLSALLRMRCDMAQGFLLGRPMTIADADLWIAARNSAIPCPVMPTAG